MWRYVLSAALVTVCMAGCATGNRSKPPILSHPQESSTILEDPRVYQAIYQKVERAAFIRAGLQGK